MRAKASFGKFLGAVGIALATSSAGMQRHSDPILPDPSITPGDTLAVTARDICQRGYSGKVRNVPAAVKRQAYANYGIATHRPGDYEVDHLISLELGGSNSIRNLWPQTAYGTWNYHVKDALENELHAEVCSGKLPLKTAQKDIGTNWIDAYKKYFHTTQPLSALPTTARARPATPPDAAQPGKGFFARLKERFTHGGRRSRKQVWVNTRSGKYFYPGAEYYGKTKEGQYMTEAAALRQGYVAAKTK